MSEPVTVYLATNGDRHDYYVHAAFSTHELAVAFLAQADADGDVAELVVDEMVPLMQSPLHVWEYSVEKDGSLKKLKLVEKPTAYEYRQLKEDPRLWKITSSPWHVSGCVMASSAPEAASMVDVIRRALIAEGKWE